eukprot:scaffold39017_cov60-Phaeocystis_antarctica.AAC.1
MRTRGPWEEAKQWTPLLMWAMEASSLARRHPSRSVNFQIVRERDRAGTPFGAEGVNLRTFAITKRSTKHGT